MAGDPRDGTLGDSPLDGSPLDREAAAGNPPPTLRPDAPGCLPVSPGCLAWLIGLSVLALALVIGLGFGLLRDDDPDGPIPGGPVPGGPIGPSRDYPEASPTTADTSDRWAVVMTDPAGGRALLRDGGPEVPHRQTAMAGAGVSVLELVGGRYEGTGEVLSIDLFGGTLAQPLTGPQVDAAAEAMLETTFRVNFPNLTPLDNQLRPYHPGPLGGQVQCASYDGGYSACGWLDEQTIGYVFVVGGTEADAAAMLVSMRSDVEMR
jgi:hypothetical protein